MPIYFDDSLPTLATVIGRELGKQALLDGLALRDIAGRLAFYVPEPVSESEMKRVSSILMTELGPYARSDMVFGGAGDIGIRELVADPGALVVWTGQSNIRLLDRRLVGADWLRSPCAPSPPPPRLVFASLKGGVGRSTALSVTAADLAARGLRVLAIDLDMEAPGLGSILLDEGTTPEFGVIDVLVENGLGQVDDTFLADVVGPSALAARSGLIHVVPAFGRRSQRYPGDVLAKISRAYTEDLRADGSTASILDQLRDFVGALADPNQYDAVLIDTRAGLHETTAASILGLGAEVFMFGLNEPQTYQGYMALFAHLARFITVEDPHPEWLDRITMVQGRTGGEKSAREEFSQSCQRLFEDAGIFRKRPEIEATSVVVDGGTFDDLVWDEEMPDSIALGDVDRREVQTINIAEDPRFRHFQPYKAVQLLEATHYDAAFGELLERVREIMKDSAGAVD